MKPKGQVGGGCGGALKDTSEQNSNKLPYMQNILMDNSRGAS